MAQESLLDTISPTTLVTDQFADATGKGPSFKVDQPSETPETIHTEKLQDTRTQSEIVIDAIKDLNDKWENGQASDKATLENSSLALSAVIDNPDESTAECIVELARAYLGRTIHDLAGEENVDGEVAIKAKKASVELLQHARKKMAGILHQMQEYGFGTLFTDVSSLDDNIRNGRLFSNERDIVSCNYSLRRLKIQRQIDASNPEVVEGIDRQIAQEEANMAHNISWRDANITIAKETSALVPLAGTHDLETEINRIDYFLYVYEGEHNTATEQPRNLGKAALTPSPILRGLRLADELVAVA